MSDKRPDAGLFDASHGPGAVTEGGLSLPRGMGHPAQRRPAPVPYQGTDAPLDMTLALATIADHLDEAQRQMMAAYAAATAAGLPETAREDLAAGAGVVRTLGRLTQGMVIGLARRQGQ